MKIVHIYSGGLDSTVLLYQLIKEKHKVECVNFNYGSKHNIKEMDCAVQICKNLDIPFETIPLDFINEYFKSDLLRSGGEVPKGHYQDEVMRKTVVPFRNGIMISIAAGIAASRDFQAITIANHAGDHAIYPDCAPPFITAMKNSVLLGTFENIILKSPFLLFTKAEIVKIGRALKVPFDKTWSCYKGQQFHCGFCGTCVERLEAFKLNKMKDPVKYQKVLDMTKEEKCIQ